MLTAHLLGVICSENEELSKRIYDEQNDKLDDEIGNPIPRSAFKAKQNTNSLFQEGLWWEYMLEIYA